MKLNKIEFLLMNNPIRGYIQEKVEVRRLRTLSSLEPHKNVLEIGCGNGTGTKLIQKYFKPEKIHAIDLDQRMIEKAVKKNMDSTISFAVGDATKLQFENNQFDAVVDFGIIHHIPNWEKCLEELKRVLKPGGELILEDLSIDTFNTLPGRVYRLFLAHPYAQMYTTNQFITYLKKLQFEIAVQERFHPLRMIQYFVVIAHKRE